MKWNASGMTLILAIFLFMPIGCSGPPATVIPTDTPTETPEPPTPTATIAPFMAFPTAARPVNTAVPVLTVRGQIKNVVAKTLLVNLVKAVQGISSIALTTRTQILTSAGAAKKWQDLKAGMTIEATGTAGAKGTIVAQRVRIVLAPAPTPTHRPSPVPTVAITWQGVQIPDIGIGLEVPGGWPQGPDWSWIRPGDSGERLGVKWATRQQGAEPIVMLPANGVVKSAIPTNTSLGRAIRYTLRITSSTAAESHVVIMTDARFIDLYATATTDAGLVSLQTALSHMLASVRSQN
ncbi:MAG: hypothetical protein M1132_11255 [Chloroflexi bacterium]|nr:hypothetical protein [Chloroflexota bacterium]